jgi:hypothetical protein
MKPQAATAWTVPLVVVRCSRTSHAVQALHVLLGAFARFRIGLLAIDDAFLNA